MLDLDDPYPSSYQKARHIKNRIINQFHGLKINTIQILENTPQEYKILVSLKEKPTREDFVPRTLEGIEINYQYD